MKKVYVKPLSRFLEVTLDERIAFDNQFGFGDSANDGDVNWDPSWD